MKKLFILLLISVIFLTVNAQVGSIFSNPSFNRPDFSFSSFLNPNIVSMHHSVSFTSGVNSSQNAFYQSVYTNHLTFNFHPKFVMDLDLNFVNMGTFNVQKNIDFQSNKDNSSMVIPNLKLSYRPSENMFISFQFSKIAYIDNNFNSNTTQHSNWKW